MLERDRMHWLGSMREAINHPRVVELVSSRKTAGHCSLGKLTNQIRRRRAVSNFVLCAQNSTMRRR